MSELDQVPDGLDRGPFVRAQIERCETCGLYRTLHLSDSRSSQQLYEESSISFQASASKVQLAGERSSSSADELSLLTVKPPARLLDIGCGAGHFLMRASRAGYGATGIDLDPKTVAFARDDLGLDARCMSLHRLPPDEKFDAVTMFGVLEHIPEPLGFLTEARRRIGPAGEVLIGVPNVASLNRRVSRLSRHDWDMFLEPGHLYHYDVRTLRALGAKAGLTLNRWATGTMTIRGKAPFLPFRHAPLERRLQSMIARREAIRRTYVAGLRFLDLLRLGDMLFARFRVQEAQ